MVNTYEIKTTKQLNTQALGLTKSIKDINKRLQSFIGCFIISYNDNKDNNPFNSVMQALAGDKSFRNIKYDIVNWINRVTNYRVKWDKDKNYYGITYKDKDDKTLSVGDEFYTTNFYDKKQDEESEQKDNTKYESIDKGLKTLDKTWTKLFNTIANESDKRTVKIKLQELLTLVSE